jgi:natural product biosynthesis luciferase-like monooxygenase protein/amino acid adenylation domain-containing protein/FkbH-like protein
MASNILLEAAEQGVFLYLKEGELAFKAKAGSLTPRLRELIKTNRDEIIALLNSQANANNHVEKIHSAPEDTSIPLSFAQQRLWLLDSIEGGSSHYNIPIALNLKGLLDYDAFERAFSTIITRHGSLRTICVLNGDKEPFQMVNQGHNFRVSIHNLSTLDVNTQSLEVTSRTKVESGKIFDLSSDLLLRVQLLKLSENDHVVLATMHHIASDGWSMGLLVKEFSSLYSAYVQGQDNPLPPLAIQYRDYAYWQRNWLQGEVLEKQLGYWENQLANLPVVHNLPLDNARPKQQSFIGRTYRTHIDLARLDSFNEICKSGGASFFMGLYSAFTVLLARYSNETDIVLGTAIANREQAEIASLIGFFMNTLVLRCDLSGDPNFSELLEQSKQMLLDAYAHQQVPFEQVVERLQPERSLSHSPLFQVMLILQSNEQESLDLLGLTLFSIEQTNTVAKYDLTLSASETETGLSLGWEYNTELFSDSTIEKMARHFSELFTAFIDAPQDNVFTARMLSGEEEHQVLVEHNVTQLAYRDDVCIHRLFEEQVATTPDSIALTFEESQLTYQALNERANQVAHYLVSQRGVKPDTLVGVCLERSLEMVIAILGILKAGGAYVPLDPHYPEARLKYMIEDASLGNIITAQSICEHVSIDTQQGVCLDAADVKKALSAAPTDNMEKSDLSSSHLAYVIYTSGSTGQPKGVMIEHRNVVNFLSSMAVQPGIRASDTLLAVTSTSFDIHGLELFLPLLNGAQTVIAADTQVNSPEQLMGLMSRHSVSIMQATPATWKMLLDAQWTPDSLIKALCGGEALSQALAEGLLALPEIELWNMYGPTETTIWSCVKHITSSKQPIGIGSGISNTNLYVVSRNNGLAPIGTTGELLIGGDGLARGYLNLESLTQERFIDNPFYPSDATGCTKRLYKTGDLARWLPDGTLECLGRIDQQVKLRGFRIELGEIEHALISHVSVQDAVVTISDSAAGEKQLSAYVVEASSTNSNEQQESKLGFSLFYFGADKTVSKSKYDFYLNSAKFADKNGFEAIWTPERHFDSVGALYPNPSILNAALATITDRVHLRAGSVVLPLHDTIRIAEEWSVVDNLSGGRVGIATASGWHNRDFVFYPDNYEDRKQVMSNSVETLKKLWRGEKIVRMDGNYNEVEIEIFPKPIQPEIPLWMTSPGNPATFIEAGSLGANVLTHLLGQTIEELGDKIQLYRKSLAKHGHDPSSGRVTVMIHTFLGEDYETVLEQARGPFMDYMNAHLSLMVPWLKSLGIETDGVGEEELESITSFAFERYVHTASLIGTPESAIKVVEGLRDIGVNEFACLIDWIDNEISTEGLKPLARLQELSLSLSPSSKITVDSLRQYLHQTLPEYMHPSSYMMLNALPLTPNGKIDKKALPEIDALAQQGEYVAPQTTTEQLLVDIWSNILNIEVDKISIAANFFELGGHSLTATLLMTRIREEFQIKIPLRDVFKTPILRNLALAIGQYDRETQISEIIKVPRGHEFPLSYSQQQLWLVDQLQGSSEQYNTLYPMRFTGELNVLAVEHSFNAIVQRHKSLKTTFAKNEEGDPIQIIQEDASLVINKLDYSKLSKAEQGEHISVYYSKELSRSFDLSKELMMRVSLMKLSNHAHVIVINIHHITFDGWSLGILIKEFTELYNAFVNGEKANLPILTVDYVDYAYWQKRNLTGDTFKELSSFWKKQLDGAPELIDLPTDKPRPKIRSNEGAKETIVLPKSFVNKLNQYCSDHECTIFMAMLSGLKVLMMAYSGQNDIVIGTSVANRHHQNIESLIGIFVNILPIRSQINPEEKLVNVLQQVKETSLAAFDHQDMPFDLLVEELNPKRSAAYNPIYQVLFVVQNNEKANIQLQDVEASLEEIGGIGHGFSKFDLSMTIQEGAEELSVILEYDSGLFNQHKIDCMLCDYEKIIHFLIDNDEIVIERLLNKLDVRNERPSLSFHHVGIACDDIETSAKLVKSLFDVSKMSGLVWDSNQKANLCILETNHGVQVELVQGPQVDSLRQRNKAFYHVCYATPDIHLALSYFKSIGATIMSEPTSAILFDNQLVAFVETHIGVIELLELPQFSMNETSLHSDMSFIGVSAIVNDFETAIWQYKAINKSHISHLAIRDSLFTGRLQNLRVGHTTSSAMNVKLLEQQAWHLSNEVGLSNFNFEVNDLAVAVQRFVGAGCTVILPAVPCASIEQRLATMLDTTLGLIMLVEKELKPVTEDRVKTLGTQIERDAGMKVVVSGSFTLEPLETTLLYWADKFDCLLDLTFTTFNQSFQQLLDPNSETNRNNDGFNVFVIRLEDWLGKNEDHLQALEENTNDFVNSLSAACNRLESVFIVQIAPLSAKSQEDTDLVQFCQNLENKLKAIDQELSNLAVLTSDELLDRYQLNEFDDEYMGIVGGKYYTDPMYTAISTNVFRSISLVSRPPSKVIVLDCDNTLWSGVCGEVGALSVEISEPFKILQQFMLEQYENGVLLCLNSKNNFEDVQAVFELHPDMILKLEHIVCAKVNWSSKSDNIRAIENELNLSQDSFIFIDDDDVQCAEVRMHCHGVTVLQVPKNTLDIPTFLKHVWAFDRLGSSTLGEERTQYYKSNIQRQQLQQSNVDIQSFLDTLQLNIDIKAISCEHFARVSEISLRTNQFNLSTIRYQEHELKSILNKKQAWIVNVSDKFGDYGYVGIMLAEEHENNLKVTDFMLSCRAMGREVEYEMVRFLGRYAEKKNLSIVDFDYFETKKNLPAMNFIRSLPSCKDEIRLKGSGILLVASDKAKSITSKSCTAQLDEKLLKSNDVGKSTTKKFIDYQELASSIVNIEQLYIAIEHQQKTSNHIERQFAKYVAPSTDIEKALCLIWQGLLGVERVGLYDHFIKLGGHSLLMLKLLSQLKNELDITLQVKDVYDCMVFADMAQKAEESVIISMNKKLGENVQDMEETEW